MRNREANDKIANIRPDLLLAGLLLFCVHYYAYVYFFPFDEGISAAPGAVKAIKDAVFVGSLAVLAFAVSWKQPKPWQANIFWLFFVLLIATSALHVAQTGWYDQVRENIKNVALFVPIYWLMFALSSRDRERITNQFFGIIVFASTTQSIFSFLFLYTGGNLWLDKVFVGFIGNPNSFALMLNLATAALLMFLHRARGWKAKSAVLLALALITATIMRTTSGSQFAIFIFLIAYSFLLNIDLWRRYVSVVIVVAAVIGVDRSALDSTVFIFQNLASTVAGTNDPSNEGKPPSPTDFPNMGNDQATRPVTSLSVTLRDQNIRQAFSVLAESPGAALLGSFSNPRFVPMDGQFWVMLYNNGMITVLVFGLTSAFVFLYTGWSAWKHRDDKTSIALHLMIAAFGITCLASRIIMYFPFNFMFFMICGLAMARATERRQ